MHAMAWRTVRLSHVATRNTSATLTLDDGTTLDANCGVATWGAWHLATGFLEKAAKGRETIQIQERDGLVHAVRDREPVIRANDLAILRASDIDDELALAWARDTWAIWRRGEPVDPPIPEVKVREGVLIVDFKEDGIHYGWNDLLVGRLPMTVLTGIVGRPLRDVVSHPLLDQADLVIRKAFNIFSRTNIRLERSDEFVEIPMAA